MLFDFVHIVKSIRNNWITEKTQELKFTDEGADVHTAKWDDLICLYKSESGYFVKPSKLTEVSVFPKPVERQKVSTYLKIFSEDLVAALKTSTIVKGATGTILFLEKIIKFWKIVNCKGIYSDIRFKDADRAPIRSENDPRLLFLEDIALMADGMKVTGKRCKTLTRDTARALAHTCRGLLDLTKHLLRTTHDYVLLGIFTTDYLEKMFGKLREGSGGTYFINVQRVLEKLSIHKAKLLLKLNVDISSLNTLSGHSCANCNYLMDDNAMDIFENLPTLEISLSIEVKETLVYIAGYIVYKDEPVDDTFTYYEKFGNFTNVLNRGGLAIPPDSICQFCFFSYILFNEVKTNVCRQSLCNAFMVISEVYSLNIGKKHEIIICNIFLNNYVHLFTPRSSKEGSQKFIKLFSKN